MARIIDVLAGGVILVSVVAAWLTGCVPKQYLDGTIASAFIQPTPATKAVFDITREAKPRVLVLYSSLHGTSEQWAKTVHADVSKAHPSVMVESMDKYNFDDLAKESVVLFLISTYDGGPPPSGEAFFKRLEDFASDSRVDKTSLAGLRYKSQFEILTDYF